MNAKELCAVVAVSRDGTIGRNNTLPWKLRSDLQRFKKLTMGHVLIMGRKTLDSIGRVLPGRQTIVLSQDVGYRFAGVDVANSLEAALALIPETKRGFVVGGAQIYRLFMPYVQHLYITEVLAEIPGDATLDAWDTAKFECLEQSYLPADEFNEWPTCFKHYRRRSTIDAG